MHDAHLAAPAPNRRTSGRIVMVTFLVLGLMLGILDGNFQEQAVLGHGPYAEIKLPERAVRSDIGTWKISGASADERALLLRILQSGDRRTFAMLRDISQQLNVVVTSEKGVTEYCGSKYAAACVAYKTLDGTQLDVFDLYIDRDQLYASSWGRFLVWHEIGHAVRHAGIANSVSDDWWESALKRHGKPFKVRSDEEISPELNLHEEVWADHFAMFATNTRHYDYNYVNRERTMRSKDVLAVIATYDSTLNPLQTLPID